MFFVFLSTYLNITSEMGMLLSEKWNTFGGIYGGDLLSMAHVDQTIARNMGDVRFFFDGCEKKHRRWFMRSTNTNPLIRRR